MKHDNQSTASTDPPGVGQDCPSAAGSFGPREWLLVAALAAAVFLVYQPAWHGGQLWDDDTHITHPELRSWHGLYRIWFDVGATQQYYPLSETAFWVQYKLWGNWMMGYHLVNIAFHALTAVMVALVLRQLAIPGAFLAAAIFAMHPVHVESVAWVTEQKNTISAVFYLAAAMAYFRFDRNRGKAWYLAALALFVLSMFGKIVTVTLPAALLVIFWWQRGRVSWRREVLPLLPFFAIGVVAGALITWVERVLVGAEGPDFALTIAQRCLLPARVIWFYLGKLVWPADLHFMYRRWEISPAVWWQYLFPLTLLALSGALWGLSRRVTVHGPESSRHTPCAVSRGFFQTGNSRYEAVVAMDGIPADGTRSVPATLHRSPVNGYGRRWRGPLATMLFFAGTLFPVWGFLNVYWFKFSYVADHFQYLASLGIISLAAAGAALLSARWGLCNCPGGYALCLALLAILGNLTWQQNRRYADVETLYRSVIDEYPSSWLAHNNLGVLLASQRQFDEAIDHYRRAMEIRPDYADVHNNLGVALAGQGRKAEAIVEYGKALEIRPDYVDAHNNLGNALVDVGRFDEGFAHFGRALEINPDAAGAQNNFGVALAQRGQYEEAIGHYRKALEINGNNAEVHNNLGSALMARGQADEAIAHYRKALEIQPDTADVHNNLGVALGSQGRLDEAIVQFDRALAIKPEYADARNNLGFARSQREEIRKGMTRQREAGTPFREIPVKRGGSTTATPTSETRPPSLPQSSHP